MDSFFAKLAYTNTLVIRLAKLTSAPIAWISCVKSSKGWKFSAEIWNQNLIKVQTKTKV